MKTEMANINGEIREAVFSDCMTYRYRLDITWDLALGAMVTIGLNPSTADHLQDDPTIRRCKEFAKTFGFGAYRMLNAFALRSTDHKVLFRHKDPVGPDNTLDYLKFWTGDMTIACWGSHITQKTWPHYYRGYDIAAAVPSLYCLHRTKAGHPSHPLYLPGTLTPQPFSYT